MPRIAVVVISWNVRDLLRRCLASVRDSLHGSGIDYTIVVVDNASSDGTPAMVRAEFPEVCLIEPGRNLGFAGGNNLALRYLLAGASARALDYILLLNPDTEVIGDAIAQLMSAMEACPEIAVAGPRLIYADWSPQPSRRRFPTPGVFFWESTPLEQWWPHNPWTQRYRYTGTPDDVEQDVDWLVGAALMARVSAIERAGLLDPGFAMYSEELEWQRRIRGAANMRVRRSGFDAKAQRRKEPRHQVVAQSIVHQARRIVYLPAAVIVHHEGKSSEQAPARRYITFQRSRLRYARMIYGGGFAAVLRLFLLAAYGAELAIEAGKWLLGHKRTLRAQRIRVYWQVLRALGAAFE